ncbi:hypothetical protein NQZ68_007087 [Dissostichus eleginoides]|nr:hypothetical protein NQZ68_007087 [Dissostichus eleginoides]
MRGKQRKTESSGVGGGEKEVAYVLQVRPLQRSSRLQSCRYLLSAPPLCSSCLIRAGSTSALQFHTLPQAATSHGSSSEAWKNE